MASTAYTLTAGDLGPEFSIGGVIPNKVTLAYATTADVQTGTATNKVIDPATLKAAFGAAVSWPCVAIVTGARTFSAAMMPVRAAIRDVANGSGSGSGVYGARRRVRARDRASSVAGGTGGG